jgi:hypothetical protein
MCFFRKEKEGRCRAKGRLVDFVCVAERGGPGYPRGKVKSVATQLKITWIPHGVTPGKGPTGGGRRSSKWVLSLRISWF